MIEFINLDALVPPGIATGMEKTILASTMSAVAEAARTEWIRLAGAELHTSRRDYMNGIQPVEYGEDVATVALVGVLPNIIEQGQAETDMHQTLLGPQVKVAPMGERGKHQRWTEDPDTGAFFPNGYFRAIPFRHGTPDSGGAVGPSMGSAYDGHKAVQDAEALGKFIYDQAQGLTGSKTEPYSGKTKWGGRVKSPYDGPAIAPKLKPYHATNIYEGMVKLEKTYKKKTQSSYMTFRTIAVDGSGQPVGKSPWIRPATQGRHLVKQVRAFADGIAAQTLAAYMKGMSP